MPDLALVPGWTVQQLTHMRAAREQALNALRMSLLGVCDLREDISYSYPYLRKKAIAIYGTPSNYPDASHGGVPIGWRLF